MKKVFYGTLLFMILILRSGEVKAQEGISITAGVGLPEMLNLGLRMQFEQTQVGVAVGTAPGNENENFTLSADLYYHFGGRSELTELRPWFLKTGLTYLQNENEWERNTTLILVPRVGREFNITSQFGIALEAGIMLLIIDEETVLKKRPDSFFGDLDLDFSGFVLPSAGINLYYRF